jgi:hypothetical protein
LSREAVHNWADKLFQRRSKVAYDARPGVETAETTVKNFYAAGVDALVKRCDICIIVGGGYVEK